MRREEEKVGGEGRERVDVGGRAQGGGEGGRDVLLRAMINI
jgi:hypothetical protein